MPYLLLVLSLEIPQIIPYSFRLQKFIIYQVMAQLMTNINQSFDSPEQAMPFFRMTVFLFRYPSTNAHGIKLATWSNMLKTMRENDAQHRSYQMKDT